MSTAVYYVPSKDDNESPSDHDRSFVVTSEGYGYTDWQVWSLGWTISVVRHTYATLKFYSPFEAESIHEQELHYSTALADAGQEIDGFNLKIGAKCGNTDILGYCLFKYELYTEYTDESTTPDGIPYVAFYSKCNDSLDHENLPNPYDVCRKDSNLSNIVKGMLEDYEDGSFSGIEIDFVDIT